MNQSAFVAADGISGLITGVTSTAGDLGGIVFLLIHRYSDMDYRRVFWVVGIVTIAGNPARVVDKTDTERASSVVDDLICVYFK